MHPAVQAYVGHTSALEDAGKALYAHFGGDPSTASHADIAGFHNDLISSLQGAASIFGGGAPPGAQNYTAGIPPGISAAGGQPPPAKMATGGMVPGRGNQDTVPALLTPGEYVIPKNQAAQIFGGREPVRMQSGGFVPDTERKPARESRHEQLAAPHNAAQAQNAAPSTGGDTGSSQSASPEQSSGSQQPSWMQIGNMAAARSGGASGGGYNVPGGGYIGGSPGAGQSGYMYPNQAAATAVGDVGVGPGGGMPAGAQTAMVGSAVSDLANGLTKAAQTYAASIKPWQVQPSHIPSSVPNYQTTNLQQDEAT